MIDCPFIDADSQYIEDTTLVGRSTDANGLPDCNEVDLGYHWSAWWSDWSFSNAGEGVAAGDINQDAVTDGSDLELLFWDWLNPSPNDANDINDDGAVNFKDYAILAQTWFELQGHPNIRPVVSGDPCNLSGNVAVDIANFGEGTWRAFLFIDGQFLGEILNLYDEGCISLDTRTYNNGQHKIKAVTMDVNYVITVSPVNEATFANDLYCVSGAESFEDGRNYQIAAMYSDANNLRVKLVDWDGTETYTSPTTSGYVNAAIPANAFTRQIYDLAVEKQDGTNWENIYKRAIAQGYVPFPPYDFAIFLPRNYYPPMASEYRKRTVAEIVTICESSGKLYAVLYDGQCTWENFASVLSKPTVKYVYLAAHGGPGFGPDKNWTQRTFFNITGSTVFSYWSPDMPTAANWHYMHDLNLWQSERIKIVHIDACYVGFFDDMAAEWLYNEIPILGQVFVSWQGNAVGDDSWDMFSRNIWYSLGERESSFYWAWQYALSQNHNPAIPPVFRYIGDDGVFFP